MIKKFLAVLSGLFFSLVGESQTVTNVVDVFDSLVSSCGVERV